VSFALEEHSETIVDLPKRAEQASKATVGLFIRSLVGLDREVAKQALGEFASSAALSPNQIEFVNLIIDHLTENGIMKPSALYESPFIDINSQGPEGVFPEDKVTKLVAMLREVRHRATSVTFASHNA
jgi:type I restriction enzyme R subunit